MADGSSIFVGKGEVPLALPLGMANRHGLIAGATGTGKTVTLRVLAEGFSEAGVPVFVSDVKGDLATLAEPGGDNPKFAERAAKLGMESYGPVGCPVVFWDVMGVQGHPVRATISEMGPLLLARLLELNETQAGVLQLAFKVADDEGLLLDELVDLKAMLALVAEHAATLRKEYGNVSSTTVGAIQRNLLTLAAQGGDGFFGLPQLEIADLMRKDGRGRGFVNVLAADALMMRPRLYATFLLWLLSELYEQLPEVGDLDRPKLVFFFDEAHLLFEDAPKALIEKIELVVRLIRSKGVGVYFVTQNPLDVPDSVLAQLGHRVQHALRAFTPRDQKAVRAAAETFRTNPRIDTEKAILELAVGEALISFLDEKGAPGIVERALVAPPRSRLGTLDPAQRRSRLQMSPFAGKYDAREQRESAHEQLAGRARAAEAEATGEPPAEAEAAPGPISRLPRSRPAAPAAPRAPARQRESLGEAVMKSVVRNIAGQVGRQVGARIIRGVLGSILK